MDYKVTSVGHSDFTGTRFSDLVKENINADYGYIKTHKNSVYGFFGTANTDYPTDPDGFEYERRIDDV